MHWVVPTSAVYADADGQGTVAELMIHKDEWLSPEMSIKEIMSTFDRHGSDELAVLDKDLAVLGVLTEAYATRRYAEELEKNRRDLTGSE